MGFGLVHVDGKNQNDFCRRASVLALRIAASSPAASSMASSSDATAPTQAESGAQLRRRRLYFRSDACDRSSLRSTWSWGNLTQMEKQSRALVSRAPFSQPLPRVSW